MDQTAILDALNAPVSEADIIGLYKILCFRERDIAGLEWLITEVKRFSYNPHQTWLNFLGIPGVADALNYPLIKQYSTGVPLKMDFGAVLFGHVWDNFVTDYVRREKTWEPHLQELMRSHVHLGDIALDIGGNIGAHAALLAELVGPHGEVHTFEPISYNVAALRRMKDVNDYRQLTVHHVAVSSAAGLLGIQAHPTNSGGNSVSENGGESEYVRAVVLDDYLVLDRLQFIKIDIEGHEGPAFAGMRKLIDRFRPTILTEFAPGALRTGGTDPVELLRFFQATGLRVSVVGYPEAPQSPDELVQYVDSVAPYVDLICTS